MNNQPSAASSGRSALPKISGDVGALILFTAPTLMGKWIDLIPLKGDRLDVRALVCEHDLPEGVSFGAVFPRLRPGIYSIESSDQKVTIVRGFVTTLDYRQDFCRIYHHPSAMSVLTTDADHEVRRAKVDDCGSSEAETLIASEPSTLK